MNRSILKDTGIMNKINYRQFIRLLLMFILIIPATILFYMALFENYISESYFVKVLPISILLSAIAVAIIEKDR